MKRWSRPSSTANPCAPYCERPTPCPQPRPSTTRSAALAAAGTASSAARPIRSARIVREQQAAGAQVAVPSSPTISPTPTHEPVASVPDAPPPAPRRVGSRLSWLGIAISLLALAGVVWWASRQEAPELPSTGSELAALVAAIALYALATVVRSERWQRLLVDEGATPLRVDAYALTCVGYMGNNVLPARAGDAIRMVLMAPRASTSKRTVIGTLLAERLLDVSVLVVIFVVVGYGLLGEG